MRSGTSWILKYAVIAMLVMTTAAWAAKTPPKGTLETYPATESELDETTEPQPNAQIVKAPPIQAPASVKKPAAKVGAAKQPIKAKTVAQATIPTKPQQAGIAAKTPTAPQVFSAKEELGFFDPVPSDQVEALGRRLKLVETLIQRHGRAYDYRMYTIRDLERILASLDTPATHPAAHSTTPTLSEIKEAPETLPAIPIPSEEDEINGGPYQDL